MDNPNYRRIQTGWTLLIQYTENEWIIFFFLSVFVSKGDIVVLRPNRNIMGIVKGITNAGNGQPKYRVEFLNIPKKKVFYYGEVKETPWQTKEMDE